MRVIEEMIEGYYSKSSLRNELINPDLKASANGTKKVIYLTVFKHEVNPPGLFLSTTLAIDITL